MEDLVVMRPSQNPAHVIAPGNELAETSAKFARCRFWVATDDDAFSPESRLHERATGRRANWTPRQFRFKSLEPLGEFRWRNIRATEVELRCISRERSVERLALTRGCLTLAKAGRQGLLESHRESA